MCVFVRISREHAHGRMKQTNYKKHKLSERKEIRTFARPGSAFKEAKSSCSSVNFEDFEKQGYTEFPSMSEKSSQQSWVGGQTSLFCYELFSIYYQKLLKKYVQKQF